MLLVDIGQTGDFINAYSYDDLGRIQSITQDSQQGGNAVAAKRVDFVFDAAGRPSEINRYSDLAGTNLVAATDYLFDAAGRLIELTHADGGTTFADYDLLYDLAGRITGFDIYCLIGGDDLDADYDYDATNQLTAADYGEDWQDDEDYTYDLNGNRVTANGDSYTTGENNQLLSDDTYTYEYDAEGNRTKRYLAGTPNEDVTEYQWDHRNRLVQVTHYATEGGNADLVVQYAYDFGNRWVRRIIDPDGDATGENLQSTIFIYDGPAGSADPLRAGPSQIVLQFDKEGTTSTPSNAGDTDLTHRYLWGTGVDQILADEQVHYDWSPEDYITDALLWPLGDHLGSVRDVVDNNRIVRIHRAYDAYGNITSQELRNGGNQVVQPGQPGALEELFAFTARPFDQDTDLQNNLHRWYDATVGRWLSEDPIRFESKDTNLYRYVRNTPIKAVDPLGMAVVLPPVGPPNTWPWPPWVFPAEGTVTKQECDAKKEAAKKSMAKYYDAMEAKDCPDPQLECRGNEDEDCRKGYIGYHSNGRIVVCYQNTETGGGITSVFQHEIMHAFDTCCLGRPIREDWKGKIDCDQWACAEIRANYFTCQKGTPWRGGSTYKECVTEYAETSLDTDERCKAKAAAAVKKMYDKCVIPEEGGLPAPIPWPSPPQWPPTGGPPWECEIGGCPIYGFRGW